MRNKRKMVIIGNGNVSIDIARLITCDRTKLEVNSRVNPKFMRFLDANQFEDIEIIARRGVVQSACGVKELRDLLQASEFRIRALRSEVESGLSVNSLRLCDDSVNVARRVNRKKLKLFESLSDESRGEKEVRFRFLLQPFKVGVKGEKRVLVCRKMRLVDRKDDVAAEIVDGEIEELEFDVLVKSLGFRSSNADFESRVDAQLPLYRCGWASSNGKGTIADLIVDCQGKVDAISADITKERLQCRNINMEPRQLLSRISGQAESPLVVMEKSGYVEFRKFESLKKTELHSLADIQSYMTQCHLESRAKHSI
jgi:hypothetical protein